MQDDTTKLASREAKAISLGDDTEIYYWAETFGVSRERLAEAVAAVGPSRELVARYLDEDALAPG